MSVFNIMMFSYVINLCYIPIHKFMLQENLFFNFYIFKNKKNIEEINMCLICIHMYVIYYCNTPHCKIKIDERDNKFSK